MGMHVSDVALITDHGCWFRGAHAAHAHYWSMNVQKVRSLATSTQLQRLDSLTKLKYTTISKLFDQVRVIRESDELVDDVKGESYYLQFILKCLPADFMGLKESIPVNPAQSNSLMAAQAALETRERNAADERRMSGRANVAAGEGMHGGGGFAFVAFPGTCYKCGERGHKEMHCPERQQGKQQAQRGRAPWQRGRGRGYNDRRPYNPKQPRQPYNQQQPHGNHPPRYGQHPQQRGRGRGRGGYNNNNNNNRQPYQPPQQQAHAAAAEQPKQPQPQLPPHLQPAKQQQQGGQKNVRFE